MVINTYVCPLCQRPYIRKKHAEKGEICCSKLSKSEEISILGLTQRTQNILKRAGIENIHEVIGKTDSDLLKLKGFGQGSLRNLHLKLQSFDVNNEGIEKTN